MTFRLTALLALAMLLGTHSAGFGQQGQWNAAKGLPVVIQSGIEIARSNGWGSPASLSIVCSVAGDKHFVLVTRLPFPRKFERRFRPGSQDNATLFVDGIRQQIELDWQVTNMGGTASTWGSYFWITDAGEPDTAFSPPLTQSQIDNLTGWFGPSPPMKVSVAGLRETLIHMSGSVAGSDIRAFGVACAPVR